MTRAELTPRQAMEMLDAWRRWDERRDELVRQAFAARLTRAEIHRITGLAVTTINRIIADPGTD